MKKPIPTLDMEFSSIPWPKPGDVLFQEDANCSQNAFLNLGGKEWGSYASGYKGAADILAQRFLEDSQGLDALTYPIVFLYRHYLELRLKELIVDGQRLLHQPIDFQDQHGLVQLWHPCRKILGEIWPKEPAVTWDTVENLLKEFDQKDPDGMCFRYPVTTKGKGRQPTLAKLDRVGIRNLYEVMNRLGFFFESHLDGADYYRGEEDSSFDGA
jgi:hypothetical protein